MLKIRLSRTGKKSQPSFRIVVQEKAAAVKGGKVVEELGYYRPTMNPKEFKVDLDRAKYWVSVGAQPSDHVAVLLKNEGVEGMDKFIEPRDKKRKKKKEEEVKEEAPKAAPAEAPAEGGEAPADDKPAEEEAPAAPAPAEEAAPAEATEVPAEAPAEEADKKDS